MGAIITKLGLEKIAKATVDKPLRIEKFAVGDGGGVDITPNEDMRSLVNERYRDLINDKYANNNNTVFESVLRANAPILEGFYIRELGLFDEDGDLIVVTDVPVQYRPATEEGNIVTELLFNISIQVQNSDVIEIKINEQVFATVDMVNRLIYRVDKIENNSKKLITSSVGVEKWFNTEDKYKDQDIVEIGIKTYALMDSSNILNIADYPMLFKNIGGVDRGDGTFAMPNFYDGTTRHLPKGSSRDLGSFEDDAMQRMMGELAISTLTGIINGSTSIVTGVFKRGKILGRVPTTENNPNFTGFLVEFDNSRVAKTDEKETRMKNTAGQWYILAKINV